MMTHGTQGRLIAVNVHVLLRDGLTGDEGNSHQKQERDTAPAAHDSAVRFGIQVNKFRELPVSTCVWKSLSLLHCPILPALDEVGVNIAHKSYKYSNRWY